MARLLTRPTLAAISPSRLSLPRQTLRPRTRLIPGKAAAPRLTLIHASRFTVPGSDARTKLAGFFSSVLKIPTAFDRLQQRHFVGILDIHPDRNAIGDTRDPDPERFQLVR